MAVWTRNGDHVHPAGIPLYSLFQPPASPTDRSSEQRHSPLALQELCSRVVGQAHPFELVQQHHPRVPEELQKRIAFWSFPLNEKQVLEHGCTVMGVSKRDISSVASWDVCDMVQTGMHLTAKLSMPRYRKVSTLLSHTSVHDTSCYRAFVQVDRGCITATKCSCGSTKWCCHILALILTRLRQGDSCQLVIHPPLSETLSQFSREQLQKLTQCVVEKLLLKGVPVIQGIACALQDRDSDINKYSGAPDTTAGGSVDEKPMWCIDQEALLQSLEMVFRKLFLDEELFIKRSIHDEESLITSLCLDLHQFTVGDRPSMFVYFLQHHNASIVFVLKWAISKMIPMLESTVHLHTIAGRPGKVMVDWCFCCMVSPALRLFFTDPAFSSSMKEDVCVSLAAAPFETASNKLIADHLKSLLSVAEEPPIATTHQLLSTLTQLQQCSGDCTSALHRFFAMLQYFKYNQKLTSPGVAEVVSCACRVLFPITLLTASSIQQLTTPTFKSLTLEQTMDYAFVLLDCLVQTEAETELIIEMTVKLLCSHLHFIKAKGLQRYHFWVETKVLEFATSYVAKSSSRAPSVIFPHLSEMVRKCLSVTPSSAAMETWSWHLMRAVCLAEEDKEAALDHVNGIAQMFIGQLGCTPIPDDGDKEALQEAILSVLVSLFTSLPPSSAQDLFKVLEKAYPQPLTFSERAKLGHKELRTLDEVKCIPTTSILPSFAAVDKTHELMFGVDSSTEAILLQEACSLKRAVTPSHVMFLKKLLFRLQAAGTRPLVILQLGLLYSQAHKCREYTRHVSDVSGCKFTFEESSKYHSRSVQRQHITVSIDEMEFHSSTDHVLAVNHLSNVWRYCITPQQVMEVAIRSVKHKPPRHVCTLILSAIDSRCPERLVMEALGTLAEGTPEQFIDGIESVLKVCNSARNPEFLCNLLQSVGRMYGKIKANVVPVANIDSCQQRLLNAASNIVTSMQLYESSQQFTVIDQSLSTYVRFSLDIDMIAEVTCDAGQDTVLGVGYFLQLQSSFVNQLKRLCAHFHNVPISSVNGLLFEHPFQMVLSHAVEARKAFVRKEITANTSDTQRIDRALKAFQAFTSECGFHTDFTNFASEMAALCPFNVRRMIEKRYLGIFYTRRHYRYYY